VRCVPVAQIKTYSATVGIGYMGDKSDCLRFGGRTN